MLVWEYAAVGLCLCGCMFLCGVHVEARDDTGVLSVALYLTVGDRISQPAAHGFV